MCPGELTALPQASWLDFGDVRRRGEGRERERERKKSGRGKGRKKRGGND